MARDIVKVRRLGESLVITLTQNVLAEVELREGDRVLIESAAPRRIIVSKEAAVMPSTQRVALEMDVLLKKREAIDSEISYVVTQHNLSMPAEAGMDDESVVELRLAQLRSKRDKAEVKLAEKRLELFELQGA